MVCCSVLHHVAKLTLGLILEFTAGHQPIANKYGVDNEDMSELFLALSENGWRFVGHTYSIEGDVSVMRKSEYDYLWTNNVTTDEVGEETNRYRTRIEYLNNKIGT